MIKNEDGVLVYTSITWDEPDRYSAASLKATLEEDGPRLSSTSRLLRSAMWLIRPCRLLRTYVE